MRIETTSLIAESERLLAGAVRALESRLETAAANLANVETRGYKRVHALAFESALDQARQRSAPAVRDFSQGALVETGDRHSIALEGPGFLALERDGEVVYGRGVRIRSSSDGTLTDPAGAVLLGSGGPLRLPRPQAEFEIGPDGAVRSDGAVIGNLALVEFADTRQLNDVAPGRYRPSAAQAPQPAASTQVRAGFAERSNVEPLAEMIEVISVQRQHQAAQRALRETLEVTRRLAQAMR